MEQLDPKDIPEVISIVSDLYNNRGKVPVTLEQKRKISIFFIKYMGKAIEDCQKASMNHWSVTRANTDVAFKSKTVVVKNNSGGEVEFIVGTSYGPHYNEASMTRFKERTQEEVLGAYADPIDDSWVMVFNSLVFDYADNRKFAGGLFVGIRFTNDHFLPNNKEEVKE